MANNITINKNSGSTIYTINNFHDFTTDLNTPIDAIGDIAGDETTAILVKSIGATMQITFTYNINDEASSVVSGGGSPVTTAIGQYLYLMNTFKSSGASQITDTYTLTFDFGGGNTLVRTGQLTRLTPVMTSDAPVTFRCTMQFQVGTVL